MVSRSPSRITDDLDGGSDADTVTFAALGTLYEIDLSPQNIDRLLAALEPFIAHARRPGMAAGTSTG